MKDTKLRLDYFLSLGLRVVKDDAMDHNSNCAFNLAEGCVDTFNTIDHINSRYIITSFAPRKNEGVQPCGVSIPVISTANYGVIGDVKVMRDYAGCFEWGVLDGINDIKSWMPDLDALIKMQIEHDKKQLLKADLQECYNKSKTDNPSYSSSAINDKQVKHRTKTEYVKVDDSIFDLKLEFESHSLFYRLNEDVYHEITKIQSFTSKYHNKNVYRKVDTEITWQDDAKDQYGVTFSDGKIIFAGLFGIMSESAYIEMCRFVVDAVDNKGE